MPDRLRLALWGLILTDATAPLAWAVWRLATMEIRT